MTAALLERLRCLWYGHDDGYLFDRATLRLRCLRCGRVTRGWVLDLPRPVRRL